MSGQKLIVDVQASLEMLHVLQSCIQYQDAMRGCFKQSSSKKVFKGECGRFTVLGILRIYSCWCAFTANTVLFVVHVRSPEICVPTNLKLDTLSILFALMCSGAWIFCIFLKPIISPLGFFEAQTVHCAILLTAVLPTESLSYSRQWYSPYIMLVRWGGAQSWMGMKEKSTFYSLSKKKKSLFYGISTTLVSSAS